MTNLKDFLDDFGEPFGPAAVVVGPTVDEAELEAQKLESFETGYKAGWDDAVKAQSDDATRISSSMGQHLMDLSFTYHEAYAHVMTAVTPLLEEMVRSVLPAVARQTLGAHILEQLDAHARDIGSLEVVVAVSPVNAEAVRPLLDGEFAFPIRLLEDATLAEEQADLRFGDTEKQIDLGGLIASVAEAVAGFAHENRRKIAHG